MVLYTIFIWHFYRFVSQRDIFPINLKSYMPVKTQILHILAYIFEYLVFFPILVFGWFLIFSAFMILLARGIEIGTIFAMSMALVATIRITSYYNEDLSRDVGKLIPLALLAIFIISPSLFSMELLKERFSEVPKFYLDIVRFAVITISIEWMLRIVNSLYEKIQSVKYYQSK